MLKISLRANNGQYVVAENDGAGILQANRDGVGPWEIFSVTNLERGDGRLQGGDRINLQAANGRFVVAVDGGGGRVAYDRLAANAWETFTIVRIDGSSDEIVHGDRVAIRANNGQYLMAESGGGREVFANRTVVREWETFIFETWNTTAVHIRCNSGQYLVAEDGGGREIRCDRSRPLTWETFSLVNRLGRANGFRSGDQVSLQAWNGRFLAAENGGGYEVSANRNRSSTWERFIIEKISGTGEIGHGDQVTFRVSNDQYFVAEGGGGQELLANRTRVGAWETFTIELAAQRPIPFDRTPTAEIEPGYPLSPPPVPVTGARKIVTLLVEYSDMPAPIDSTLTLDHIREAIFGDSRSIRRWIEYNSYGVATITNEGVYGPIRVPLPYSSYINDTPLNATRSSIGTWETFTIERVAGAGRIANGDTVRLLAHNGKYVVSEDGGGGFVFASTAPESVGSNETFVVVSVSGGDLSHDSLIAFRSRLGFYFVAESGGNDLIKADRRLIEEWETFRIKLTSGSGSISSGNRVAFQANNGSYVVADSNAFWCDVLNAAERQGISLSMFDTNSDGTITSVEILPLIFDFSDVGGVGATRRPSVTTVGRVTYTGSIIGIGLYLQGGPTQGADQLYESLSTTIHELSHSLYNLGDRYFYNKPVRGDVIANQAARGPREIFRIELVRGSDEIRSGSQINLMADNGSYVVAEGGGGGLVNADRAEASAWETFTVEKIGSGDIINNDDVVVLKANNNQYLFAQWGGDDVIMANYDEPEEWAYFQIERTAGPGPVRNNDQVAFRASNGSYVVAEPDGRTTDPRVLEKGYQGGGACGWGVGGNFDIMDNNCRNSGLTAYDRIKFGWIGSPVLTPENRACYRLRPVFDNAEALILWDPLFSQEWYVVENRQHTPFFDEVSSNGIVISWVNENGDYWERWLDNPADAKGRFPVVISAVATDIAPNPMIAPPTMNALAVFKRQDPGAAFRSGEIILPRGDGSPSRFRLSFHAQPGNDFAVCIS